MAIPKDYVCDGQLNIWDFMTENYSAKIEPKPKLCEGEPDDSICEGCKWRETEGRELEVDEHGQTWVYKCPGTACANWKHGTPLNLTAEKPDHKEIVWYEPEDKPYCFNRNFLPSLEETVRIMEDWFGIKFEKTNYEYKDEIYNTVYVYKCYGKSTIELDENVYSGGDYAGERFIGVDWNAPMEGTAGGCLSLYEVEHRLRKAISRAVKYKEEHKHKKRGEEDEES